MLTQVDKYAPETEVHKYLHSRLASFDAASLYELHYQMITLGKVSIMSINQSMNQFDCPWDPTRGSTNNINNESM